MGRVDERGGEVIASEFKRKRAFAWVSCAVSFRAAQVSDGFLVLELFPLQFLVLVLVLILFDVLFR